MSQRPSISSTAEPSFSEFFVDGEIIYARYGAANRCYFLKSGRVRLVKHIAGRDRTLLWLGEGDVFGLEMLIQQRLRTCTAIAVEACEAIALDPDTVVDLMEREPGVARRLIRQLIRRLYEAEERVENQWLDDPTTRVVHSLLLAAGGSKNFLDDRRVSITPLELSSRTGLTIEQVKRAVKQLRDAGYVELRAEQMLVNDLEPLRALHRLLELQSELGDEPSPAVGPLYSERVIR
ncbi:MAG: Crp/Fnr family transcriptional regulator [Polyangiales bacterium]